MSYVVVRRDEMSASGSSKRYANNWDEYASSAPSESAIPNKLGVHRSGQEIVTSKLCQ